MEVNGYRQLLGLVLFVCVFVYSVVVLTNTLISPAVVLVSVIDVVLLRWRIKR